MGDRCGSVARRRKRRKFGKGKAGAVREHGLPLFAFAPPPPRPLSQQDLSGAASPRQGLFFRGWRKMPSEGQNRPSQAALVFMGGSAVVSLLVVAIAMFEARLSLVAPARQF